MQLLIETEAIDGHGFDPVTGIGDRLACRRMKPDGDEGIEDGVAREIELVERVGRRARLCSGRELRSSGALR